MRRITGILVLKYGCVFLVLAYLAEKYSGISGYVVSAIAGILAITCVVLISEKKVREKFDKEE